MKINGLKKLYAAVSIIFLLTLAISPLKNYFKDWRDIQNNFNETAEQLPQKVKPVSIGLKQIWVRDLDRIDRCVTCHLGIDNSKLETAGQPFKQHSKIYHDIEKFGCTICHEGQGLATEYEEVHLPTKFWDRPLLPKKYIQSSCGKCHINENLNSTHLLNFGKELITDLNCAGCHNIPEAEKNFVPALDGIGSKIIDSNWLVNWLKNPVKFQPDTKMPNFLLTDLEAKILTDFLLSFKSFRNGVTLEPLPEVYNKNKNKEDFITLGQTRFREARCISCHAIEGKGGKLAPDLLKIASKTNDIWIYNYLKNTKRLQPEVEMPQYGFSDEEVAAVTAYMVSEFVDWDAEEDTGSVHIPLADFYEKGLALFNKYNCSGCHQLSAKGINQNTGPDLTEIGSKKIYQIDWGKTNVTHTVYDYIENKVRIPREFGGNTRMPQYNLTKSKVEAITAYLLSLKEEKLPVNFIHKTDKKHEISLQGEVGRIFNKYACLKCHSLNNSDGAIAPDLTIVGSQLKTDWLRSYFKLPYSIRPIVEERMPNLFISKEEVEILINYFNVTLLDDSLSIPVNWIPDTKSEERGSGLFFERYGCQSCHIIKGKGGYVGPPLDKAGSRLKSGWIYNWLMNPQKYKPKTIEPRTGMPIQDALDITTFLMSLKETD
ncbi:MAG: hypothetical protein A2V93_06245 [Ignavibacteria bacterium RBG_16_34_14]|nr:MAG: hypothetical protein A2V93_06245 [Ignavibacteria bacterium RBG_16_34_14]